MHNPKSFICTLQIYNFLRANASWHVCSGLPQGSMLWPVAIFMLGMNCSTVSLKSTNGRHLHLPLWLCEKTLCGLWKWLEFSSITWTHTAFQMSFTSIYIHTSQSYSPGHQSHVSYATDSPTATTLGLFSSLFMAPVWLASELVESHHTGAPENGELPGAYNCNTVWRVL